MASSNCFRMLRDEIVNTEIFEKIESAKRTIRNR